MEKKHAIKWGAPILLAAALVVSPVQLETANQSAGADEEYANLANDINLLLQDQRLEGATTGVSIRKADTGELVYDHFGDSRLTPASNTKLFSGMAALETLGEEYRFSTEIHTDGKRSGEVLQGNLYLKGKGDPTLLQKDFEGFAAELKRLGIKKVKGDLIGDDTWYDDERLSEDITWKDERYYYGAEVSALTASPNADYDAGSVIVEVNPGEADGAAKVTLTPHTDYVNIINQTKTVAAGSKKDISIIRAHGSNDIIIEGEMPLDGSRSREWIAVTEPSGYALDLFENALIAQDIELIGDSEVKMGRTPEGTTLLLDHQSMPLRELYIPFMKLSNNGHAEVLVKEMGRTASGEGSWNAGLEVVEQVAAELGVDTDTIQLRDGSGMSHVNMVPANEISALLYGGQAEEWHGAFVNSLPVAGKEERFVGGTLRNRMKNSAAAGNVTAKTGSLTGVSSLSGYATTRDGEKLIFSIVINNDLATVTPVEDAIASAIANYKKD